MKNTARKNEKKKHTHNTQRRKADAEATTTEAAAHTMVVRCERPKYLADTASQQLASIGRSAYTGRKTHKREVVNEKRS